RRTSPGRRLRPRPWSRWPRTFVICGHSGDTSHFSTYLSLNESLHCAAGWVEWLEREGCMVEPTGSLGQLIESFQLRRRAAPEAFEHGVRLANVGAVDILVQSDRHLRAEVLDASLETVTIRV